MSSLKNYSFIPEKGGAFIMNVKLLIYLILLIVLTACKSNFAESAVEEKTNMYYNEIKSTLDGNTTSDIKIIMTKSGKQNEELILYTYYSNIYKKTIMGIKAANWNHDSVEYLDITEQVIQSLPISFGSILQENNNEHRIITYGTINDSNIKNIKILYTDTISIEEETNGVGFMIIRNNFFDGVIQINAYDKDLNEMYKFPDNV